MTRLTPLIILSQILPIFLCVLQIDLSSYLRVLFLKLETDVCVFALCIIHLVFALKKQVCVNLRNVGIVCHRISRASEKHRNW